MNEESPNRKKSHQNPLQSTSPSTFEPITSTPAESDQTKKRRLSDAAESGPEVESKSQQVPEEILSPEEA
jgi:hypothetical protein